MARYAIDAPTLLRLVDERLPVEPGHQLVAPSSIRSAPRGRSRWPTLGLTPRRRVPGNSPLQADALVTVDPDLAAKAKGVTQVASLQVLLTE